MSISIRTQQVLGQALADPAATIELLAHMGTGTVGAAISALTVTPTSGSLPTATGAITIADTATPTVVELLKFCVELNTKLNLVRTRLTAFGVTA